MSNRFDLYKKYRQQIQDNFKIIHKVKQDKKELLEFHKKCNSLKINNLPNLPVSLNLINHKSIVLNNAKNELEILKVFENKFELEKIQDIKMKIDELLKIDFEQKYNLNYINYLTQIKDQYPLLQTLLNKEENLKNLSNEFQNFKLNLNNDLGNLHKALNLFSQNKNNNHISDISKISILSTKDIKKHNLKWVKIISSIIISLLILTIIIGALLLIGI